MKCSGVKHKRAPIEAKLFKAVDEELARSYFVKILNEVGPARLEFYSVDEDDNGLITTMHISGDHAKNGTFGVSTKVALSNFNDA